MAISETEETRGSRELSLSAARRGLEQARQALLACEGWLCDTGVLGRLADLIAGATTLEDHLHCMAITVSVVKYCADSAVEGLRASMKAAEMEIASSTQASLDEIEQHVKDVRGRLGRTLLVVAAARKGRRSVLR